MTSNPFPLDKTVDKTADGWPLWSVLVVRAAVPALLHHQERRQRAGLWISVGLIERYGGTIEARNADSGGAVFSVTLWTEPQVPEAAAAPTNNGRPEAG